ncbi:hypothetical protein HBB16_06395 [Pseudonocardia sp. MCCB 268]|nr:hypothetical protein [Pseudonocardia cytotoxica]
MDPAQRAADRCARSRRCSGSRRARWRPSVSERRGADRAQRRVPAVGTAAALHTGAAERPHRADDEFLAAAEGDLLVVDESAMTDTASLSAIHVAAERAGAKRCWSATTASLPPSEPGG